MKIKTWHKVIIGIFIVFLIVMIARANLPIKPTLSVSSKIPIRSSSFLSIENPTCEDYSCGGECTNCPEGGFVCCDTPGWTWSNPGFCEGECIPGQPSCSNDPSKSLDCSDSCSNGYVYDYSYTNNHRCCPPSYPFLDHNTESCSHRWMWSYGSDNYYTRHSECRPEQEDCDGTNYKICTETSTEYIFKYDLRGIVKGKCGVDCLSDTDCPPRSLFGEEYCSGLNIMQKFRENNCMNYKCLPETIDEIIESCNYKCENAECVVQVCTESDLRCDGNNLEVCQNNQFILKETCKNGCENYQCKSNPVTIYLIIGGILAGIGILIFVYFKFMRGKR